jgi:hypothetical protein
MAIKFGMTVAEMIAQLIRGFRSVTGRDPDGLERIKIQQEAVQRFKEMNKVVDMEGKPIDVSKGIMGGKQIQDSPEFGKKIKETYDKAKGPGKGQEMVDALGSPGARRSYEIMEAQLGVRLYGDETFDEILEIQKTGKHPRGEPPGASLDDEIKQAYDKAVKEDKFKNVRLKDGRKIESEEDFREYIDELNEDSNFAQGGRAGFEKGGMSRRKFMKIMGGLAALPIVGKFFKAGKVAAPAVETVKETVQQAPNYFFELADKIRKFGKESKVAPQERVRELNYKGKDGSEYTLTEDLTTGDMQITKDRTGMAYSDEVGGYDVIEDRTVMEYKSGKGMTDETTGAKVADEYDEYKVEFDPDGTPADATDVDEITKTEIVKEVTGEAPSIKKAGGGIAMMLGE